MQWTFAYLAGAWLTLEVTSLIGGHLGWPAWIHRVLIVLAGAGLPIALVVAWYHGEKGRQRVSGPEVLMVAALLVLAAVGVHFVRPAPPSTAGGDGPLPATEERSIAVLPLDDLSPGDEYAYFAGAMTEEITSALTQVPDLMVTSRTSASKYAESDLTLRQFAREIGVRHVLEGSVQRSGNRVRVTVQLIDARTDGHLWSETYERTLSDLFDVQAEIAGEVADRLAATFTDRERERIVAGATEDAVAYDLYLRAASGAGAVADRRELLERAVERAPDFWPAWEALAFHYEVLDRRHGGAWGDSARAALDRGIRAADHPGARLRLEARRSLMFGDESDEETAVARLRAAAEEHPSDLFLVDALADFYRVRGRLAEAADWRWRAARLDPLNPGQWAQLWSLYWWAGMYEAGEQALQRVLELDPGRGAAYVSLSLNRLMQGDVEGALTAVDSAEALTGTELPLRRGFIYWWAGRPEEAVTAYADVDVDERQVGSLTWLLVPMTHAELTAGDTARAGRTLDRVRDAIAAWSIDDYEAEQRVFSRLQLAAIEGDPDRAVRLFRRYIERGGHDPTWFEQSPLFAELRADPEFREELARLRRTVDGMRREMERELPRSF